MQTKNLKLKTNNCQGGYVALMALLIIAATGLTIGLAVSISGIEEVQTSYSVSQAAKSRSLASACIEDGLERLRNDFINYSGSLSIGDNSCIIEIVVTGNQAIINATGTVEIYNQKIQAAVNEVNNSLEVISWVE